MVQSIPAFVNGRYANGQHFPLFAAQWAGAVHQCSIQLPVMSHHGRMYGMDLDDVVRIRNAFRRLELGFRDVANEGHDPNEADEVNLRKTGSQLRARGALPKFMLKRLHQMVTVRNLVRSTEEGTT